VTKNYVILGHAKTVKNTLKNKPIRFIEYDKNSEHLLSSSFAAAVHS